MKLKIQDVSSSYELKNQSNAFANKQATYQNVNMDKMFLEKFNQIFLKTEETEENKGGYGSWMQGKLIYHH